MTKIHIITFYCRFEFSAICYCYYLPIAGKSKIAEKDLGSAQQEVGSANIKRHRLFLAYQFGYLGRVCRYCLLPVSVGLLLGKRSSFDDSARTQKFGKQKEYKQFVVLQSLDLIFSDVVSVGMYIIIHGHLTPGGGFQGGACWLLYLYEVDCKTKRRKNRPLSKSHYRRIWVQFYLIGVWL